MLLQHSISKTKKDKSETIITREGYKVDVSSDTWDLPYSVCSSRLNFSRFESILIREALKNYVIHRMIHTSTHAGKVLFEDVAREILPFIEKNSNKTTHVEDLLVKAFEQSISKARADHRLWALYRPIQWYIWSETNNPSLGFSSRYAKQLSGMTIPGNPKGEAVKSLDPEKGPLDRSIELPLIIKALEQDNSKIHNHLQEKAAIALSIALGRNPSNLTYLRESDLSKLTPDSISEPTYILKVPRIKKRQLHPRDDYMEEYLDPLFGKIVEELINANKKIELVWNGNKYADSSQRPLFIKQSGNSSAIKAYLIEDVFNMESSDISSLLQSFVSRHNIISPITKKPLKVSARRFRYTLATSLASEGISTKELARILDHSDTQNVQVYYDTRNSIVAHLDKALSQQFAKYVKLFQGKVISDKTEAINGDRDDKQLIFVDEEKLSQPTDIGVCGNTSICHLDPPFSCYLCPKFQPYKSADHDYVLESLLEDREQRLEKYENARLGVQLDDVIIAVTNVINICRED